jgi:hypothetical protein
MQKPVLATLTFRILLAVLLLVTAAPSRAVDLPLAAGSPMAGFQFDDRPLILPVQQNFQMALLTASGELGRSCGKMEAYGWRMRQSEQNRVDQIFNNTVDRLRALGYVVESQSPSSVSKDVTMFTADRPDKHFIFMWSAGEIGLVMVLCESSPPLINKNATEAYAAPMPLVRDYPATGGAVVKDEIKTPAPTSSKFSPIGRWAGSYSCAQGYTGGTLDITSLRGQNFEGTFSFYSTPRNRMVPSGSYRVNGQYDKVSHRILINPGKWIKRPRGYYNTIIVGVFDPLSRRFSGVFQGISGCTSFEAKASGPVKAEKVVRKKTVKKKKKPATPAAAAAPAANAPLPGVPAPDVPAPAAAQMPAVPAAQPNPAPAAPAGPPPAPGIALPPATTGH